MNRLSVQIGINIRPIIDNQRRVLLRLLIARQMQQWEQAFEAMEKTVNTRIEELRRG